MNEHVTSQCHAPHAYARELAGVPPATVLKQIVPGVDFRMIPQFEEKIIERRPGTLVVQDWKGNICEISVLCPTSC